MFHGMGAYPSDSYYDPGRPDWLPYWIDDTIESRNKYARAAVAASTFAPAGTQPVVLAAGAALSTPVGQSNYTNPPAPGPVQAPDMSTDPTGQYVDIDQQIAEQKAAQNQNAQYWATAQNQITPVDNLSTGALLNKLGGDQPGTFWYSYGPYLVVGGVALALFAFAKR